MVKVIEQVKLLAQREILFSINILNNKKSGSNDNDYESTLTSSLSFISFLKFTFTSSFSFTSFLKFTFTLSLFLILIFKFTLTSLHFFTSFFKLTFTSS